MYVRSIAIGILAALDFAPPAPPAPTFTLESTGAVHLTTSGYEARYGVVPSPVKGRPVLLVSVGDPVAQSVVHLVLPTDRLPAPGRYPIGSGSFQASFMAGPAEHPLGFFRGESGWVTITKVDQAHVEGTFTVRARGFLAANVANENEWVTVQGRFDAEGDSSVGAIASAQ
jgi:hypothetical protein